MKTGAVNPNGNQAGIIGWQYYDFVAKILYVCSVAGNASTAQWTAV